jgi:small subunit ribosomal protein S17
MKEEGQKKEEKTEEEKETKSESIRCKDVRCPFHGKVRIRGRIFKGTVRKIVGRRAVIEFERLIYIKKYERYMKKKTRLHAHIPECIKIEVNDSVQARECRPLSKIIHFIIIKKLSDKITGK